MLIKFIFLFLINVLVCNAFYGYPLMPYPPINPYGMMPTYNPYMNQGPYIEPEIIDIPASAENDDLIIVSETINPNLTQSNAETRSNSTENISGKPLTNSENKTSSTTPIDSKEKKPDNPILSSPQGTPSGIPHEGTPNGASFGGASYSIMPFNTLPYNRMPYSGMPYGGMPYSGMPYGGMPYGGMPYGGMPYGGLPYGGLPYGGMPYGGMPYGGMSYGGMPYNSMPYNGMPQNGMTQNVMSNTPPGNSDNTQTTKKPLLDPMLPPYPYAPSPTFKVVKQETSEPIREVVRGPVTSSSLTVSEPLKAVILRTIDPKTGEAVVKVVSNNKENDLNSSTTMKTIPEVTKSTVRRNQTFRARTK